MGGTGKLLDDTCPLCDGQCQDMVSVEVKTVAGETLSLTLTAPCEVMAVKEQLSTWWSIPVSCIELIHQETVLKDGETLQELCEEGETNVSLQMLVSMQSVLAQLESGLVTESLKAFRALVVLGQRGRSAAFGLTAKYLDHDSLFVRDQAFSAVMAMTGKGDPDAVALLLARVNHADWRVRCAVIRFLGSAAACGDKDVTHVLARSLGDSRKEVVLRAMQSIIDLASANDRTALAQVMSSGCLAHQDWHIRKAVLQTIAVLPGSCDEETVAVVRSLTEDVNSKVRAVALAYM